MMNAALWQHVVAIAMAAGALGWLVRRAVKGGGSKATGSCASCPASKGGALARAAVRGTSGSGAAKRGGAH
jgi:hypothetical protein